MASTLTVKVHPVVYLTIADAFERRSIKPGANDKELGTLLGFYEKNAIQVAVTLEIGLKSAAVSDNLRP